jgi:hypothetical protein
MNRRATYRLTRRQRFARRGFPLLATLALLTGASTALLLPAPASGAPALYTSAERACIAAGEC